MRIPNLAVNLVIRNEAKRLPLLMPILAELSYEIVVVDQESVDDSRSIVKTYPNITLLMDEPTGYPESSRQLAYDNTKRSDWIFVLDADEFPTQYFLDALSAFTTYDVGGFFMLRSQWERVPKIDKEVIENGMSNPLDPTVKFRTDMHYRLFKKGNVGIGNYLHQGINVPHLTHVVHVRRPCIISIRTKEEWELDHIRYKAVMEGSYNRYKHL